jgi:hypothetical protein
VINAFDPMNGEFLGQLKDGNGNVIVNSTLRGMTFGEANTTHADTLFITSSPSGGSAGVFAAIAVNTGGAGPDFTLRASPNSGTVSLGQSTAFSLTATPVADFRGAFSFSCAATAGVTCTIGQSTIDATSGAATVTLTATAGASSQPMAVAGAIFPGLLLAGICVAERKRVRGWMIVLGIATLGMVSMTACGGYGRMMQPTSRMASIVVTVTAGSVSHTSTLSVTVQ